MSSTESYTGRIIKLTYKTYTLSGSAISHIGWRRNHEIYPKLNPTQKFPSTWLQGHTWLEGEFGVKSDYTGYHSETTDDSFATAQLTVVNTDGSTTVYTIYGMLIYSQEPRIQHEQSAPVTVYRFKAFYCTKS